MRPVRFRTVFGSSVVPAGQAADIYYYDDATNHRFIIEYFRVGHFPTGLYPENFEIILYDPAHHPTPTGDGEIVVQYLTELQLEGVSTIGIENYSETVGIEYCYNANYDSLAVPITDDFAILYTTKQPTPGIEELNKLVNLPVKTMMSTVYPNPFARDLRISYQLASSSRVSLMVYDVAGRAVCGLVDGVCEPGYYAINWNGCDNRGRKVPAGVYFVRFHTVEYQQVQKTVLLR